VTGPDWKDGAPRGDLPDDVSHRPPPLPRPKRTTFTAVKAKIVTAAGMFFLAAIGAATTWVQTCNARDNAVDAASAAQTQANVAKQQAAQVPQVAAATSAVAVSAAKTGAELDASYQALLDHLTALDKKLADSEARIKDLEAALARSRHRRPRVSAAAAQPLPALPPTPAAARVQAADIQPDR